MYAKQQSLEITLTDCDLNQALQFPKNDVLIHRLTRTTQKSRVPILHQLEWASFPRKVSSSYPSNISLLSSFKPLYIGSQVWKWKANSFLIVFMFSADSTTEWTSAWFSSYKRCGDTGNHTVCDRIKCGWMYLWGKILFFITCQWC